MEPLLDRLIGDDISLGLVFSLLFFSLAFLVLTLVQAIRALRRPGLPGLLYAGQIILGFWAITLGAVLPWTTPLVAIASLWITWKLRAEDPGHTWLPALSSLVIVGVCIGLFALP